MHKSHEIFLPGNSMLSICARKADGRFQIYWGRLFVALVVGPVLFGLFVGCLSWWLGGEFNQDYFIRSAMGGFGIPFLVITFSVLNLFGERLSQTKITKKPPSRRDIMVTRWIFLIMGIGMLIFPFLFIRDAPAYLMDMFGFWFAIAFFILLALMFPVIAIFFPGMIMNLNESHFTHLHWLYEKVKKSDHDYDNDNERTTDRKY